MKEENVTLRLYSLVKVEDSGNVDRRYLITDDRDTILARTDKDGTMNAATGRHYIAQIRRVDESSDADLRRLVGWHPTKPISTEERERLTKIVERDGYYFTVQPVRDAKIPPIPPGRRVDYETREKPYGGDRGFADRRVVESVQILSELTLEQAINAFMERQPRRAIYNSLECPTYPPVQTTNSPIRNTLEFSASEPSPSRNAGLRRAYEG